MVSVNILSPWHCPFKDAPASYEKINIVVESLKRKKCWFSLVSLLAEITDFMGIKKESEFYVDFKNINLLEWQNAPKKKLLKKKAPHKTFGLRKVLYKSAWSWSRIKIWCGSATLALTSMILTLPAIARKCWEWFWACDIQSLWQVLQKKPRGFNKII
jgi:hypothetical protein